MLHLAVLLSVAQAAPRAQEAPLELVVAPLPELWFDVRACAELGATDGPRAAAVEAASALADELGHPLAFGMLEGVLAGCSTTADLLEVFERLPEMSTVPTPGERRSVKLREPALALARALAEVEEEFLAHEWPAREAELVAQRAKLLETLDAGRQARALELFGTWFGVDRRGPLSIRLVTRAPAPGGVTVRSRSGPVSFVATEGREPLELAEVSLHEGLHALDVQSPRSLLGQLRSALEEAGSEPELVRGAVHHLFFLAAGEAVRRTVDPDYVDYGERTGVYARAREADALVRDDARRLFAAEIGRAELVEAIVHR